jgi:hypothetical protein
MSLNESDGSHSYNYLVSGAARARVCVCIYTGCPRRNVPDFGRVFLMLKYTDITPKHLCPKLNGYGENS